MEKAALGMATRKRKAGSLEVELTTSSSSQMKTRRLVENSASSSTCDVDHVPASCCSGDGSSDELTERSSKFVDLEEENEVMTPEICGTSVGDSLDCGKRRETSTPMTTESRAEADGELESTARPRESSTRRRSAAEKMPSEAELEEFFAAAENNLHKQFTKKYNYDFVKEQPLEGRYEWVEVQQKP